MMSPMPAPTVPILSQVAGHMVAGVGEAVVGPRLPRKYSWPQIAEAMPREMLALLDDRAMRLSSGTQGIRYWQPSGSEAEVLMAVMIGKVSGERPRSRRVKTPRAGDVFYTVRVTSHGLLKLVRVDPR